MDKIGVFDSGLGGYTIVNQLQDITSADIIFLADQKHLPYGNKTKEELMVLMQKNLNWFKEQGVKTVFLACNTVSSYIDELQALFPELTIRGIIEATVKQFNDQTLTELLVIATQATIDSGQYQKQLQAHLPSTTIHAYATPQLASLVEDIVSQEKLVNYLDGVISDFERSQIPVLLACTQYPIVGCLIGDYLDGEVYDSLAVFNEEAKQYHGNNKTIIYTTGDIKRLSNQIKILYAKDEDIRAITIE